MINDDKALLALMKDQVEAWLVEDDVSDWWKWQRQYALAADRIEALTAENERLREALEEYGEHKFYGDNPCQKSALDYDKPCVCGLDEILAGKAEQ